MYSAIISLQDSLLAQVSTVIAPQIDVSEYQQLINSGGLRYIHNIALKDTMALYAGRIQYFESYNSNVNSSIASFESQIGSLQDIHD